ncbi:MAG: hypothetical protein EON56_04420 [Alphaproteobacteria bacterium]|nr:MAG: hypothetical protein EON56_04420 [Alphaproteobacteria bacterium]
MKPALRHIAVTVVERGESRFGWQLLEQDREGQWKLLEESDNALPWYAAAMSAGLERLQSLVHDLATGPREAAVALPTAEAARRTRSTLFGFGQLK